jgi:hypothetical protein
VGEGGDEQDVDDAGDDAGYDPRQALVAWGTTGDGSRSSKGSGGSRGSRVALE